MVHYSQCFPELNAEYLCERPYLPRSFATTNGLAVSFGSSEYFDDSVLQVCDMFLVLRLPQLDGLGNIDRSTVLHFMSYYHLL